MKASRITPVLVTAPPKQGLPERPKIYDCKKWDNDSVTHMPPEKGAELQYIDKECQVHDSTETQVLIVNDLDGTLLVAKVSC